MSELPESPYVNKLHQHPTLWQDRAPVLGRLDIELTERCNFNCVHCYINQPASDLQVKARETSTEQVKRLLKEAADLGCLSVRFTGGEPLLREDFEELYMFARRLGLKVMLFTNASLITPHLADLFARVPPLEKIEITIYGMSAESYAAVTGVQGAYKAVMRGVDLLLERQVPFAVKGALLPPNAGELEAFETWASSLPWMDEPPGISVFFDLRARGDSELKNASIQRLRPSPDAALALTDRHPEEYHKEMADFCSRFIGPVGDVLFACGAGQGACVDAYGKAQLCMLLRHPGTVYDLAASSMGSEGERNSLQEALQQFFPGIMERRAENPDYLERCARCFLKGLCEQCPAKSWMEHGTLDTPVAYLCQVAHAQARLLGLLADGERGWEVTDWRERVERMQPGPDKARA